MTHDAFYERRADGLLVPTPATVGPWDPGLQHGSPPAALLGAEIERTAPRADMRVVHFALELFAPVPLAPMSVGVEIVRPGKKIELLQATASIDGRPALRATAWRMLVEDGRCPETGFGDAAPPSLPDTETTSFFDEVPRFGYGDALEWRFAEGSFDTLGPAAVWARLRVPIVRGEPPSQLARLLAMVDSANGISAVLEPRRYTFVPVNLTVSVARAPAGEWVGMRAVTRLAAEGVGTTHARLFDARGFLGDSLQTLWVAPR